MKDEERGWQCVLCAWHMEQEQEPTTPCPNCGCQRFREYNANMPLDRVSPEAVSHLKKRVEKCWNYADDPQHGRTYHPLELVKKTRRAGSDLVAIQDVCKTCGTLYSQTIIPTTRTDLLEKHHIDRDLPARLGMQVKVPG